MIRVSAIVLIGLLASALLRRQSAALRHWVLAASIGCAAAMPVLQLIVPAWQVPMGEFWASRQGQATVAVGGAPAAWRLEEPAAGNQPVATNAPRGTLASLQSIWLAGVAASLSLLLMGFGRLARVTSRSREVVDGAWCDAATELADRRSPVQLLQSDHPTLMVTWGLGHPKVILPRDAREWPADRIRAVLGHELAHVERHDWAVQMVAEVLRCVYWFNPLLWVACRRLRQESERACDDAVLSMGVGAPEYATHLLDVARAFRQTRARRSLFPAPAMARRSHLEGRVRAMLNLHVNRAPVSRLAGIAIAVGLLAVTVPVAGLVAASGAPRPVPPQPPVAATASVPGALAVPADRPAIVRAAVPPAAPRPEDGAASAAPVSNRSAQTAPAAFSGTLMDATGRAMPGVPMTLLSKATSQRYDMRSDEAGQFAIGDVPAGEYQVGVQKPGFLSAQGRVILAAGQQLRQDVVAQIGSLEETVVVQGPGPTTADAGPVAPRSRVLSAQPDTDPCSQSAAGGCLTPPRKLVDASPMFPRAHAADGVSGTVVVDARVGTDGFLKDLRPNEGADPNFAASALDAVRLWQFSPVRLNGIAQECRIKVTVLFSAGT